MPVRPELDDGVVQVHADAPAHADHHGLAVQRLLASLEVLHQVRGNEIAAMICADRAPPPLPICFSAVPCARPPRPRSPPRSPGRSSASARPTPASPGGFRSKSAPWRHRHGRLDVIDSDVIAEHCPRVRIVRSIGVPVKPMKDALGNASRMWRAKPSMKSSRCGGPRPR